MPIIVPSPSAGPGSIVDYDTLQIAVANWLHRDDLSLNIPDFIQLAELRIYRELRVRQMETAFSTAISAGVIALPTSYLELKNAYVNGAPVRPLTKKDAAWIYENYPTRSAGGTPSFIAREATNFIFGPYPDSTYTIKGIYFKKLDALSEANPTNWLTSDAQDLILFASLCEAAPYLQNDARIALWEAKYEKIKDRLAKQDMAEEFAGSPMAMVAR